MAKKVRKPLYLQQQQQQPFQQKPFEVQDWIKKQKLSDEVVVKSDISENEVTNENSQDSVINVDKDDPPPPSVPSTATTATSSTLPSLPNSAFYPYVDPLHFFIDLRVSADYRKKEAYLQQALREQAKNNNILLDTNTWTNPIIGRNRTNSAFKVPGTTGEQAQNFSAINLIQSDAKKNFKRSDDDDAGIEKNEDEVQIFDLDKSFEK